MKNLVCPHCQTAVKSEASVCLGCGAEIVRGASRRERTTGGCLVAIVGLVVTMGVLGLVLPAYGIGSESGLAIIIGLIIAAVILNVLGRVLVGFLFRSRLRFFRTYRHQ